MAYEFKFFEMATDEVGDAIDKTPEAKAAALLCGAAGENCNPDDRGNFIQSVLNYLDLFDEIAEQKISEVALWEGSDGRVRWDSNDVIEAIKVLQVQAREVDPVAFRAMVEKDWDEQHDEPGVPVTADDEVAENVERIRGL